MRLGNCNTCGCRKGDRRSPQSPQYQYRNEPVTTKRRKPQLQSTTWAFQSLLDRSGYSVRPPNYRLGNKISVLKDGATSSPKAINKIPHPCFLPM